jgi:phosphatidylserine/phosphatidylglycerophosphate/cardiolipin synthase-like enzyme
VHERGINIRLIIDRNKYEESVATRQLLSGCPFPFRLTYGRAGAGSKMHHKFVVLDQAVVLTGSYNWTFASEEQNYENLLILRERSLTETHHREFESLLAGAEDVRRSRSWGLESKEPAKSLNDEGALPL